MFVKQLLAFFVPQTLSVTWNSRIEYQNFSARLTDIWSEKLLFFSCVCCTETKLEQNLNFSTSDMFKWLLIIEKLISS